MNATTTADYNIEQLSGNTVNNYRYVYVDSVDGNLTMHDNRWLIDLSFYIAMGGNLPMNMLNTSITLPYATISAISLNYNPYSSIPSFVRQPNICKVYQASINIDTSGNKFFEQQISNYDMYLLFSFNYDPEIISKTTFNNESSETNNFLNEWILQKQSLHFNYSNYLKFTNLEGWFDNSNQYYLISSSDGGYSNQSVIYYKMNNECDELKKPITYLLTLQTKESVTITNYRVNFYYSVGNETKIHEYHYENKDILPIIDTCDINLNVITAYDDITKDVTTNLIGNKGFYIPIRSAGYYEVITQIAQNNNIKTYCFHKNFSFSSETYYDHTINIKPIFINSINNNFKRMTF